MTAARARDVRNLLATLFLSQGTVMLGMGDELGRSQMGNNNAYCQDNELSWLDWHSAVVDLASFVAELSALRRAHPALRREQYLHGNVLAEDGTPDVQWLLPDGRPAEPANWQDTDRRAILLAIAGDATQEIDKAGSLAIDSRFVIALNAGGESLRLRLPPGDWTIRLDTSGEARPDLLPERAVVLFEARSTNAQPG